MLISLLIIYTHLTFYLFIYLNIIIITYAKQTFEKSIINEKEKIK